MKKGGEEGEKGRNGGGGREGERRKEKDAVGHDAGEPREGRPPSAFEDTQVLSPIVFRCRLLHASLHRPAATTPRGFSTGRRGASCACTRDCLCPVGQRYVAGRYDSRRRCRCSMFRWVNGPRAPGETTGCWEKFERRGLENLSLPGGYRYYRSDFARLSAGRTRKEAGICHSCTVHSVPRVATLGNARKRFENLPAELFSRRLRNAKFSLPNPGLYGGDITRVQVLLPSRTFPPLF